MVGTALSVEFFHFWGQYWGMRLIMQKRLVVQKLQYYCHSLWCLSFGSQLSIKNHDAGLNPNIRWCVATVNQTITCGLIQFVFYSMTFADDQELNINGQEQFKHKGTQHKESHHYLLHWERKHFLKSSLSTNGETSSHTTQKGTLVHSHLSSLSWCGSILPLLKGWCMQDYLHLKKEKKRRQGMIRQTFPRTPLMWGKSCPLAHCLPVLTVDNTHCQSCGSPSLWMRSSRGSSLPKLWGWPWPLGCWPRVLQSVPAALVNHPAER